MAICYSLVIGEYRCFPPGSLGNDDQLDFSSRLSPKSSQTSGDEELPGCPNDSPPDEVGGDLLLGEGASFSKSRLLFESVVTLW